MGWSLKKLSIKKIVVNPLKKIVVNPARTITTVGTFGLSEVVHKINPRAGNVLTNVYGGTVGGGVSGFLLGGPAGAAAGAAAGLGKGIYGAVGNKDPTKSLYQGALYGAAAGSVAGVIYHTGAAGAIVSKFAAPKAAAIATKTAGVDGVVTASGATAAASGGGGILGSLGSVALLSLLQRPSGQPAGSPGGDVSVVNPGGGGPEIQSPATGPWNYPGIQAGIPDALGAGGTAATLAASSNTLFLIAGAALVALFLFMKRAHA